MKMSQFCNQFKAAQNPIRELPCTLFLKLSFAKLRDCFKVKKTVVETGEKRKKLSRSLNLLYSLLTNTAGRTINSNYRPSKAVRLCYSRWSRAQLVQLSLQAFVLFSVSELCVRETFEAFRNKRSPVGFIGERYAALRTATACYAGQEVLVRHEAL